MADTWLDQGILGAIRSRTRERNIEDAQRNFLTDPDAAIAAVNQVKGGGPDAAYALQQRENADKDQALKTQQATQTRYLGAVKNMAGMLADTRAKGGDIGATFDTLTPVLTNGLGMKPDEIQQWKSSIVANPTLIDSLQRSASDKLINVAAGGAVVDPVTKQPVYSNPGVTKPVLIRRGDGGTDAYTYNPATGQYEGANGPVGSTPNGAAPGGAPAAGETPPAGGGIGRNNPLNMRDPKTGSFRNFATPDEGMAATQQQLSRYFKNGKNTINTLVDGTGPGNPGWLGWPGNPGQDNSPEARANYKTLLQQRLGLGPNDAIPPERINDVIRAQSEAEGSTKRAAGQGQTAGGPVISTPGRPAKGTYRPATTEEKVAAGVDPSLPFQVSPDGKMEVTGPTGKGSPFQGNSATAKLAGDMLGVVQAQKGIVNDSIDDAIKGANGWTTGMTGSALSRVPGTDAYNFAQTLNTIKANLAIDKLQQMRNSNKTGGALGNVSDKDMALLQATSGSLDLSQTPEKLVSNLRKIKQLYTKIEDGLKGAASDIVEGTVIKNPTTGARMVRRNGKWEKM